MLQYSDKKFGENIGFCSTNNNNQAEVIIVNNSRIEVRTTKFNGAKARINCISKDANNRLLWHGSLYWVTN